MKLSKKFYLSFLGGELVFFAVVEGPDFAVVLEHPLAQVVGDIEGAVVVAAELVVDDHDRIVNGRLKR